MASHHICMCLLSQIEKTGNFTSVQCNESSRQTFVNPWGNNLFWIHCFYIKITMFNKTVCVCHILLIGINTASSVCTAHLCITLPSLLCSVSLCSPFPGREEEGSVAGERCICSESRLSGAEVSFLSRLYIPQRHYVDLKEGSSGCIRSCAALLSWMQRDEFSFAVTAAVLYVAAQKVTAPWPCTHKSVILSTGSVLKISM